MSRSLDPSLFPSCSHTLWNKTKREPHLKTCPAGLRVDLDPPFMLLHDDIVRDIQTQALPFTWRLGG